MSGYSHSANRITVDRAALRHNYRTLKSGLPPETELMAMVKGDGYGHGMVTAARAFAEAGCRVFGVAELCEGVALREAGQDGEIFVMVGFLADQAEAFVSHDLTPVVYTREGVEQLSRAAVARGRELAVHLKLDCGMSRLGVLPEEAGSFADLIDSAPGLRLAGILSHFPEADNPHSSSTSEVFSRFTAASRTLTDRFSGIRHIANSGAVLNFPETLCNMARAGISLYGYSPDGIHTNGQVLGVALRPAMRFTTVIAMVKDIPCGQGVSYGHTYVTSRPTRLAVLPVGYEDGYPRALSNCGEVLINGRRVPLLGRVCMNLCMADVTDLAGVRAGDEAVLLGRQGDEEITADDLAKLVGTINYEILCMLGNNNQRVTEEHLS